MRHQHKDNDQTTAESEDYIFKSPDDFLRSVGVDSPGESTDHPISNENSEEGEDNSLDERDFGFLTQGWDKHEGQSCLGFADDDRTVRSLHLSKLMCASNFACQCIECKRGDTNACTLRGATKRVVRADSDSYTRTDSRRNHNSPRVIVHPGKHKSKRGPSYKMPKADVDWKKHEARSCHGFASLHPTSRDLEASKLECARNIRCYGIECERTWQPNPKDCTLRSQVKLQSSVFFSQILGLILRGALTLILTVSQSPAPTPTITS